MALRFELQCWHHASKKPIGMNVRQRLMHLAAAGALPTCRSGPPRIWPLSLRFAGMRCSSPGFRRCEPVEFDVSFAGISVGGFWGLPPNNRVNRTAGKRCLPVRFGLRPTPAGYAERWAAMAGAATGLALAGAVNESSFVRCRTPCCTLDRQSANVASLAGEAASLLTLNRQPISERATTTINASSGCTRSRA